MWGEETEGRVRKETAFIGQIKEKSGLNFSNNNGIDRKDQITYCATGNI